jgi:hypothetical protein
MKTYQVTYTETLVHTFYVEAHNEEEADKVFREKSMECEFDFSDGEITETGYVIECVDEFEDEDYVPSSTNGDYSPSNPWDAPGMSIKDFI